MVRHGVNEFDDAGYTYTVPALNNIWPRRWWPNANLKERTVEGAPEYAGSFLDGFGNRITVHAAANPRETHLTPAIIRNRVTGYGIVTFDRENLTIKMECWPRYVDPLRDVDGQYDGWPVTVGREDGDGRTPIGFLPRVRVSGVVYPVFELHNEIDGLVYSRRLVTPTLNMPVYRSVDHIVRVGVPERPLWQERRVTPGQWGQGSLDFTFTD